MALHKKAAPAILLPFLLAGCGEWVHPTKAPNEFARDDAACEQEAIGKLGFVAQKEDAPKWLERATGTKSVTMDGNENLRNRWKQSCLRVNGWAWRATASRPSASNTDLVGAAYRFVGR